MKVSSMPQTFAGSAVDTAPYPASDSSTMDESGSGVISTSSDETGDVVRLELAQGVWSRCGVTMYPICTVDGKPFQDGMNFKTTASSLKNKRSKLVVRDGRKRFVAVICKEVTSLVSIFKIYSPIPTCTEHKPAKRVSKTDMVLYEWAEVISAAHKAKNTLGVWNGSDFEPCFTSEKELNDKNHKVSFRKHGIVSATLQKTNVNEVDFMKQGSWTLEIRSGRDSLLMVCFAAIVDELEYGTLDDPQTLQKQAESVSGMIRRSMFPDSDHPGATGTRNQMQRRRASLVPSQPRRSSLSMLSAHSARSSRSISSARSADSSTMSLSDYLSQHSGGI